MFTFTSDVCSSKKAAEKAVSRLALERLAFADCKPRVVDRQVASSALVAAPDASATVAGSVSCAVGAVAVEAVSTTVGTTADDNNLMQSGI